MYNVAIALAIIVIAIWPLWVIEYPIYIKIWKKKPLSSWGITYIVILNVCALIIDVIFFVKML